MESNVNRDQFVLNYMERTRYHIYNLCQIQTELRIEDARIAVNQGLTATQYAELIVSALLDIDINDSSRLAQRVGFIGVTVESL